MQLVDTETPDSSRFARTPDGKIDFDAYIGLTADYHVDGLVFLMRILGSRQRFGHLDLAVTPMEGSGERWVELKNLVIHNDPARIVAPAPIATPAVVVAEETPTPVAPTVIVEPMTGETVPPVSAPVAPIVAQTTETGSHWTEVAPTPAVVATQEVVEDSTTDMEAQVENILNEDSPVIK